MLGESSVPVIEHVLRSDRSIRVLTYLHERRLQVSTNRLTASVEEFLPVVDDLPTEDEPDIVKGRDNTGTPYTVEDRGNGGLAPPAVHQSDTAGLPVPGRTGSPVIGLRT